jgi:hypothetical protein
MIITPINSTESAVHLNGYVTGVSGGGTGLDTYGEFHDYGGGNTLALTTSFTEWQTGTGNNNNNITLSTAPVKFTIDEGGVYKFDGSFSVQSDTNNSTITAAIFVNGVIYASSETSRAFSGSSTTGSFSMSTLVDLDVDDEVTVRFKGDQSLTMTIINISTNMLLIGPDNTSGSGSVAIKDVWPISTSFASINIPEILRKVSISSSSATDVSTSSGAHQVVIRGLDNNYNRISEIVALNGQNPVYPSNPFIAINSIEVSTSGTDGTNKGIIYAGAGTVTSGVPAVPYCAMDQAVSISETLCFTVPRNHVFEIEYVEIAPKTLGTTTLKWQLTKSSVTGAQEVKQVIYSSMYRTTQLEDIRKFHRPITINSTETLKMNVSNLNANGDVIVSVVGKLKVIDPNDT